MSLREVSALGLATTGTALVGIGRGLVISNCDGQTSRAEEMYLLGLQEVRTAFKAI